MWGLCWRLYFDNLWLIPAHLGRCLPVCNAGDCGGCFNRHHLLSPQIWDLPRWRGSFRWLSTLLASIETNLDSRWGLDTSELFDNSNECQTLGTLGQFYCTGIWKNLSAQPHVDTICQIRSVLYWAGCNGPASILVRSVSLSSVSAACDIVSRLRQLQHSLMSGTYLWSLSDALMSDVLSSKPFVKERRSFKSQTCSYKLCRFFK